MNPQLHIKLNSFASAAIILLIIFCAKFSYSQNIEKVMDLSGLWKFSIGDNAAWASPNYNDSQWETIRVSQPWEEQGFNGYDGYAWYRKSFTISVNSGKINYFVQLGFIDDVDGVYLNGQLIGQTGSFPPNFSTAYNANRIYSIPENLLNRNGNNVLTVRVYDAGGEGGIINGDVALMVKNTPVPDFDLQGKWKFKTTNSDGTKPSEINYEQWSEIVVPGFWDDQGFKYFDGVASYAREFVLNGQFDNKKVVLLLGRIDDLDQVYLNGILIGQSGEFKASTVQERSETYNQLRAYHIPDGVINQNGKNILIVKVMDTYNAGGIYEGPIGLMMQENYIKYWRNKKENRR